ncbi:MAG TPA: alpha/beta hydrolase [Solirubrobacteraceae bacterium]|nr:alpha/beta hydrolase [Solirubrobacteraceae bacterium]
MPDARVQSAIDHWAPRFIQAGVDYNDFARTTARVERWEDWLDAWCETGAEHAELARAAEAAGRSRTAGDAWLRAAVCFHFGKFVWVLDAGRARAAADRAVAALRAAHRLLDPTAERVETPLGVVANLRRPARADRPPLALLIPGLDSTKEEFFRLENLFLERGMATLSMDGPGQGEGGYAMPMRHDYEVGVTAILDAVSARDDLDLTRVGALGVSLGGYFAPRAAAFEPRIRAVAGISGPFCFGELWDSLPELTRETFVHKSGGGLPRALEFDLAGVLDRVDVPALFVTGKLDRLIPWESTRRQAEAAPRGEFVLFEDGNHVCANIPYKARPLVADWMAEKLA